MLPRTKYTNPYNILTNTATLSQLQTVDEKITIRQTLRKKTLNIQQPNSEKEFFLNKGISEPLKLLLT